MGQIHWMVEVMETMKSKVFPNGRYIFHQFGFGDHFINGANSLDGDHELHVFPVTFLEVAVLMLLFIIWP